MRFFSSHTSTKSGHSCFLYEKRNHLGNVLTVVSDRKIAVETTPGSGIVDHFIADIVSSTDYYAFGSIMPGRNFNSNSSVNGFNGMRKDNEINVSGGSYDFGARMYDSRLGRWWAVDALYKKYESFSPYNFCLNNPIINTDPDGNDVKLSILMKVFHPKVYKAYMNLIKTEEGQKLLSPFMSAKEMKKYYGGGQAGIYSKYDINLKVGTKSSKNANVADNQGFTSVKINGESISSNATTKQDLNDDSKIKMEVYINPSQVTEGNQNIGGYTQTGAHELGLHLAPAISAIVEVINGKGTPEQKQLELESRQKLDDPNKGLAPSLQHSSAEEGNPSDSYKKLSEESQKNLNKQTDKDSFKSAESEDIPKKP